ncbi:MAG: helix-turn-helix domain-containing protein [Ruminococcus flavefaciens]|nr:helix-turn-helix domain-containing protein [Ruminococcus flavefaciens]
MYLDNYQPFCELFYSANYVSVFCYDKSNELKFTCSALRGLEPPFFVREKLLQSSAPPSVYFSVETGLYGVVEIKNAEGYLVVGPVFSGDTTSEILHGFMSAHVIEHDRSDEALGFLNNTPKYSYNRFLSLLAFLHFSLNGQKIDAITHFNLADAGLETKIADKQTENAYKAKEEIIRHGTYYFEQQMLDLVKQGNVGKLHDFLNETMRIEKLQEGKLSDDPIRQAKNLFIGSVTMIGKVGAIKGGLDIEQTYQLIDTYIQECEKLFSLDSIKSLQYNMLIDFTKRVAENKIPEGISEDIFACIQFINNHTNDNIGIDDVAAHIKKSRAYVTSKFKKELGVTINEYIINQKLIEAKNLLKHTNKSLTEITYYLCFSSQSYFLNLFKKKYGITPQKYREKFIKN